MSETETTQPRYSLGCEIEFMTHTDGRPSVPGFSVYSEYYNKMWEINSFCAHGDTVPELVHKLNEHVRKVTEALAPYDAVYSHAIPIHRGFAFCGVHLHIQDKRNVPTTRIAADSKARDIGRAVVDHINMNRGLSVRQVFSHHIWGASRESSADWKTGRRFSPCLFNAVHNTYELRIIDFDQIRTENNRALMTLITKAFSVISSSAPPELRNHRAVECLLHGIPSDFGIDDDSEERDEDGNECSTPDSGETLENMMRMLAANGVHPMFEYIRGESGHPADSPVELVATEMRVRDGELCTYDARLYVANCRTGIIRKPDVDAFVTTLDASYLVDMAERHEREAARARARDREEELARDREEERRRATEELSVTVGPNVGDTGPIPYNSSDLAWRLEEERRRALSPEQPAALRVADYVGTIVPTPVPAPVLTPVSVPPEYGVSLSATFDNHRPHTRTPEPTAADTSREEAPDPTNTVGSQSETAYRIEPLNRGSPQSSWARVVVSGTVTTEEPSHEQGIEARRRDE